MRAGTGRPSGLLRADEPVIFSVPPTKLVLTWLESGRGAGADPEYRGGRLDGLAIVRGSWSDNRFRG